MSPPPVQNLTPIRSAFARRQSYSQSHADAMHREREMKAWVWVSKRHCTTISLPHHASPSSTSCHLLHLLLDPTTTSSSYYGCHYRLPSKKPPILYASLLQACAKRPRSFLLGQQLHATLLKRGLDSDRFVSNSLLSLYSKLCPDLPLVRRLFRSLPYPPDVVAWTTMLSLHLRHARPRRSLLFFSLMARSHVPPNAFTLSIAIKACSLLHDLAHGRCFHGAALLRGLGPNRVVATALVDMYGRTSAAEDALRVFNEMLEPDAICWTSVVSALTRNDRFEDALRLFYSMVRADLHGSSPDGFTFGSVLTALGNLSRARQGKQVHAKVITGGLHGNVVVESSVVDMYGKCKLMEDSRKVFDRMPTKNMVSWCALLGGYCQNGDYNTVLTLFRGMGTLLLDRDEGDHYSFGTVIRACAGLAAVRQGKEVHCQYLRTGGWKDVVVESALVDLYAKCGLIDYACRLFVHIKVRNLITWNAMICGFAQNGRAMQAVDMFDEMVAAEGIRPDYISFIGVLFACSHTGLVEEGKKYFKSMTQGYGIAPGIEHYNCMVDLLSRVGLLGEAEDLLRRSAYKDDSSLWAALLGACATYANSIVAERVAKKMMELQPGYHLSYVLLANVYKKVGRWDEALKTRRLMRERGVRKAAGKSWIEVKGDICFNLHSTDTDPLISGELPKILKMQQIQME